MQNFDFALQVMVIGFSVVIVTLAGLYGILIIFSRLFYKQDGQKPFKLLTARSTTGEDVDDIRELRKKAAIVAAVYQYLSDQNSLKGSSSLNVMVQSSGSTNTGRWHLAGRKELLENRVELEMIRRNKKRENI